MKKFNEFLTESQIDIKSIRNKLGVPSFREMEKEFHSGDKEYDALKSVTYSFEISIKFEGFEPTILEAKLIFDEENPTQSKIEDKIKDRLKVFNNIESYQVLSAVIDES